MIIQTPNRGNIENKTNCVTHIPQDIKLKFENNALVLKAGSKIYIPNGFEEDGTTPKFDEVITEEDFINTDLGTSTTDPDMWFYPGDFPSLSGWSQSICLSGPDKSVIPDTTVWVVFYETSTNIIYIRQGDTTWRNAHYSLPIALGYDTSTLKKLLTVFNGVGYIGKHVFVLPGVKGLCPDGFNPDGTTKNKEVVIDSVHISYFNPNWTTSLSGHKFYFFIMYGSYNECQPDVRIASGKQLPSSTFTGAFFNEIKNYWEWYANGNFLGKNFFLFVCSFYGTITATDASISGFVPAKVFEEKPQEDLLQDYSLAEVYTGKHWIDGKKIYRKAIVGVPTKTEGTYRDSYTLGVDLSSNSCEDIINSDFYIQLTYNNNPNIVEKLGGSSFTTDTTLTNQWASAANYNKATYTLSLGIVCRHNWLITAVSKIYGYIEYTKTTD